MGKWSHLVGTIPNLPPDAEHDEAMMARVEILKTEPLKALVVRYNEEDAKKKAAEKTVAEIEFERECYVRAITAKMEAEDLKSIQCEGFNFTPKPEPYAQVKDKAAFREWAMKNMPDSMTILWQTLNAVVKTDLETGDALPAGVEVFLRRALHRTKAT